MFWYNIPIYAANRFDVIPKLEPYIIYISYMLPTRLKTLNEIIKLNLKVFQYYTTVRTDISSA